MVRVVAGGVIITPPTAFRFFTAKETEGVGVGSGVRTDLKFIARKHFSAGLREAIGKKPPVIANDNFSFRNA